MTEHLHPCEQIAALAGNPVYGTAKGICRITGKQSEGMPFSKWVRDTFNDHAWLLPGTIISNAALFCFDEASPILQQKTGRDKLQRFRTYSHVIDQSGHWHCLTKADKSRIVDMIVAGARLVCLTDTGQKHIFFKHRPGFWQLDETFVAPDVKEFQRLHDTMAALLSLGFSQREIITGSYIHARILKVGIAAWQQCESKIKNRRGQPIFDFAAWLMYSPEKTD